MKGKGLIRRLSGETKGKTGWNAANECGTVSASGRPAQRLRGHEDLEGTLIRALGSWNHACREAGTGGQTPVCSVLSPVSVLSNLGCVLVRNLCCAPLPLKSCRPLLIRCDLTCWHRRCCGPTRWHRRSCIECSFAPTHDIYRSFFFFDQNVGSFYIIVLDLDI